MSNQNAHRWGLPTLMQFASGIAATLMLASVCSASAPNVYIAQASAGAANGADCADAYGYSFFNTLGNWGSSASQIGPGTVVHVCGTFTMLAGTVCALSFQGSGTSGNQITLLFEANALATAPYWTTQSASSSGDVGGFICSNGNNYLTVDGGTNGTIQATANGASLGNNNSGAAIDMDGCSNCEVKDMTISNMYQAVANNAANNNNTYAIVWNAGSNVTIDNNTVHDCRWCIQYWYTASTQSNISIYNNTIYNTDHCISIGDDDGDNILNGTNLIYGNVCHDWALFDTPGNTDHHDGFHIWAVHGGSEISGLNIYNNYLYGDMGQYPTAYLYIDVENGNSATSISTKIFNNVIANTSATDLISTGNGGDGELFCQGSSVCSIYNNTFIGSTTGGCCSNAAITTETTTGNPPVLTLENNIYDTMAEGVDISEGGTIATSNYNDYYNLPSAAVRNSAGQYSLAAWQGNSGSDANSVSGNPDLSGTYTLQSGSAAIGLGTNLTGLGITALDSDKAGVARPPLGSSQLWSAGAYQYQSTTPPNAPTSLIATPH